MPLNELKFHLGISSDEYLKYYQGNAKNVITTSIDGRNVQFPANILQPFLMHEGIYGLFSIRYDEKGKLIDIEKIE